MANEAISEERLRQIEKAADNDFYARLNQFGNFYIESYHWTEHRRDVRELLSALREAQEHAEKAEKAGYRRGIQAAIEIAQSQEGSHEQQGTHTEFAYDAACQTIAHRIRALLPETEGDV